MRFLTVRWNHGAGINTGPGGIIENCKIYENGQFGIDGTGIDERSGGGYSNVVVVRNTEVFRNRTLGIKWGFGAGGSKFAVNYAGSVVENCWFHDNDGPGIWFDIDNRNTTIRSNLVENNIRQIFYEVSYGPAQIYWNIVRGGEIGILNSNSANVEIFENAIYDNAEGIEISHDDRGTGVVNGWVHHNDIAARSGGWLMLAGSQDGIEDARSRVSIDFNTYRAQASDHSWWSGAFWSCCGFNFSDFQGLGYDVNGRTVGPGTPSLPSGAVPFTPSAYGQQ
jgi:hypothetical protein